MIIFDNHLHLRRDGRFLDAVKEFKKSGGTHFILCQYPMVTTVIKEKSYESIYQTTLQMAQEIREKIDVGVYVTVGPYPVDYLRLIEVYSREETIKIMKKGMDQAAQLCTQGLCVGIGEIGRPHFPVDPEIIQDANIILEYGMQRAKDVDAPVIIHSESTTPQQCKELVEMGRKAGLPARKIVKHFSPPLILETENYGLMPSVLASKKNILEAVKKGTRFLMETDYIDDPRRPGAVLSPKTVPKRSLSLLEQGIITQEDLYMIHHENPKKIYDIDLDE
jgi:TatD-related deoxyribonuclease